MTHGISRVWPVLCALGAIVGVAGGCGGGDSEVPPAEGPAGSATDASGDTQGGSGGTDGSAKSDGASGAGGTGAAGSDGSAGTDSGNVTPHVFGTTAFGVTSGGGRGTSSSMILRVSVGAPVPYARGSSTNFVMIAGSPGPLQ